jgi:hypothetical protein
LNLSGGTPRREVCRYDFVDERGTLLFQKIRYALSGGRGKDFRYYNPAALPVDRWRKPPRADNYIYNLPRTLAAVSTGAPIHWTVGEKDADALIARGHIATSTHQGAGKVSVAQTAWLRCASAVYIWVDKDTAHPEVGAFDACLRHDRLREVGCLGEINFLKAAGGWALKDVHDHLAAGYTVEQALVVDPARLAAVAARYSPRKGWSAGYGR